MGIRGKDSKEDSNGRAFRQGIGLVLIVVISVVAVTLFLLQALILAGRKFTKSSSFAAALPKYRYFSFLYPIMESIVFTALYKNPSTGPPTARYNIGAITPSEVFSATVSIAAFATPSSSRCSVSLPTNDFVNFLPARISACLMIIASFLAGRHFSGKKKLSASCHFFKLRMRTAHCYCVHYQQT